MVRLKPSWWLATKLAAAGMEILALSVKLRKEQEAHRRDVEWGRGWLRRYNKVTGSTCGPMDDPPSLR